MDVLLLLSFFSLLSLFSLISSFPFFPCFLLAFSSFHPLSSYYELPQCGLKILLTLFCAKVPHSTCDPVIRGRSSGDFIYGV